MRYFYDDFGSLAEAEYGDGARQWRNPDVMGNVYDSADRTDRTYARGGQLREDRRWRYHYDKQGNLVLKTKRKISPIAETPQGDRKSVFGLFSGSNTSKEKGREDGALTWQPGDYAYTWLPNGMLGSVTRPDRKIVTFKYDALGRRIEKTFNGRVHRYLWDGDVVLHEWEYDETERPQPIVAENGEVSFDRPEPTDNLVTWVYDTGSYVPTAKLVNGKRYGIVSDYIGRPVQAYDEHGTLVWQADYDIYGSLRNIKGDRKLVPFRQLGQYEDEETGLYYNRFRYYDPSTGGYISQDPIRLAGENPTLYGYVHDPNSSIDPQGLELVMVYHYTSKRGYNMINSQNPIKFKANTPIKGHPKGVYVTTKSPEVLSRSMNGYKKLGLTSEKSSHFFEFQIDDTRLKAIKGDRGSFIKYIEGDLEISKDKIQRKGSNPCKK